MKCSKKTARLIGLACVLAILSGAAVGVMKHEEKKEQIRNSDEVILQIPADTVTALSWDNGTRSLSFHKDGAWLYDEDSAFPVDEEKIGKLLAPFENFGVSFRIEDVEDYGLYGLDEPECTIRITARQPETPKTEETAAAETGLSDSTDPDAPAETEAGADESVETEKPAESSVPDETEESRAPAGSGTEGCTYEIRLGDFSTMDSKRYVSVGDGKVYLVSEDPMELFDAELRDLIDQDEDLSYTSVSGIRFAGSQEYSIYYEVDSADAVCSEDVYFTEQNGKTVPLDTKRVGSYLDSLTTLNPQNYVNYKVTDEELADYGLDRPELTVSVDYTETDENEESRTGTFVLRIGRNSEDVAAADEAARKAEEEKSEDYVPEEVPAYVRIGDSRIIYEITGDRYESLMEASYNDLRHQNVFAADFESVSEISIALDGCTYVLSAAPDEKDRENTVWSFGDEEIDITDLQEALESLQAQEFTDEAAADREEIALKVRFNLPDRPETDIQLYRYDGDTCLAKVNGEVFALVDRSDAVDLIEAAYAIVLN